MEIQKKKKREKKKKRKKKLKTKERGEASPYQGIGSALGNLL